MRKLFGACFLFLISSFALISQVPNTNDEQTKVLLDKIAGSLPHGYDNASSVIEGGSRALMKSSEFVELQGDANSTWSQTVNSLQFVAPTDTSKAILLEVFESSLSADNYLQFLDQMTGLAQQGAINKTLLGWALMPGDKNVRGILDYNYDKPLVKAVLQKVKALYASDPNMLKYCDDILSGAAKKGAEAYFNDNIADQRPPQAANSQNASQSEALNSSSSVSSLNKPGSASATIPSQLSQTRETSIPVGVYGLVIIILSTIAGFWYFLKTRK